jgi:hypothetical protein
MRDHRPGLARFRVIQKKPHAECLGPLDGDEPHLSADMIRVYQIDHLCLVALGIFFQPGNSLFDHLAKPGTDLKTFIHGTIGDHGWHLDCEIPEA